MFVEMLAIGCGIWLGHKTVMPLPLMLNKQRRLQHYTDKDEREFIAGYRNARGCGPGDSRDETMRWYLDQKREEHGRPPRSAEFSREMGWDPAHSPRNPLEGL